MPYLPSVSQTHLNVSIVIPLPSKWIVPLNLKCMRLYLPLPKSSTIWRSSTLENQSSILANFYTLCNITALNLCTLSIVSPATLLTYMYQYTKALRTSSTNLMDAYIIPSYTLIASMAHPTTNSHNKYPHMTSTLKTLQRSCLFADNREVRAINEKRASDCVILCLFGVAI